jgi:predicted RNA binding protein YcfA (HicA-like mRNA interferase family)
MKPISGKRMCRVLESRGWELVRISGSHYIYRHATSGRRTSVPVHGNVDLKPKTQHNIMRDAGLTDDEL